MLTKFTAGELKKHDTIKYFYKYLNLLNILYFNAKFQDIICVYFITVFTINYIELHNNFLNFVLKHGGIKDKLPLPHILKHKRGYIPLSLHLHSPQINVTENYS